MKLRRRIGSVFLAFAMALSLIPSVAVSALAGDASGTPHYPNGEYTGNGMVRLELYTTDLYKLLMIADPTTNAQTEITEVTLRVKDGLTDVSKVDFTFTPAAGTRDTDRYVDTISNYGGQANADNISYLEIDYNGASAPVRIMAKDLRFVYNQDSDGTHAYTIKANNDAKSIVAFYDNGERGQQTDYYLYDAYIVNTSSCLNTINAWPETPTYTGYTFVNWDTYKGGGAPFLESTIVNGDTEVFSQKINLSGEYAGTEIHVMNRGDYLLNRFVELYNAAYGTQIDANNINMDSVKITVYGKDEETHTNPNYNPGATPNRWQGENNREWYLVQNKDADAEGLDYYEQYWNKHVNHSEISKIIVSAELTDGATGEVTINRGTKPGDFAVAVTSPAIIELHILQKGEVCGEPDVPQPPGPTEPDLSVTKRVEIPGGKETASVGDKLEYTITVTNSGDAAANDVTVWDSLWTDPDGSVQISGEGSYTSVADVANGYCTVDVPANGETKIYYTYTVPEEKAGETLTNEVWIDEKDDGNPDATVTVIVDEEQPEVPDAPTTDDLNKLFPNGVQVDCLTQGAHDNKDYDLEDNTYTTTVEQEDGKWTCKVIVTGETYVEKYEGAIDWPHTANNATRSVTLVWEDGKWAKQDDNNVMVVFDVKCQAPDAPTYDQLARLFKVQIDCITSDKWGDQYEHKNQDYSLIKDSYTLGNVTANADGAWNLEVTVAAEKYVEQYSEDRNETHTLVDAHHSKTVTLVYQDGAWSKPGDDIAFTFDVECNPEYDLFYHGCGGFWEGDEELDRVSFTFPYFGEATIKRNEFVRDGYVFEGWALEPNGEVRYQGGEDVTFNDVNFPGLSENKDADLYAVWAEDKQGAIDPDTGEETGDGIADYRQVFVRYKSADAILGFVNPTYQAVTLDLDENGDPIVVDIPLDSVATANEGAEFIYWMQGPENTVSYAASLQDAGLLLKGYKPGWTYEFTAYFMDSDIGKPEPVQTYEIDVDVINGTGTFFGAAVTTHILAMEGEDITIAFAPDAGYALDTVTVDGEPAVLTVDGTYTFTDVAADHSIAVVYATDAWNDKDDTTTGGDDIPDKYQVVVEYVAGNGGKITGKQVEVLTIYDANGHYSTVGDVTATGSQAAAFHNWDFSRWVAPNDGVASWHPTLGQQTIEDAKGGNTYVFTARFRYDPYIPPVVDPDPDDPTPPVDPDKPQLNTEDHYAYIVGYEDGTVRPEGEITRAEVATIFFRLLTDESRNEYWSQTNDYTDVAEGDWYNNAVSTLSNAGILNGYEDGSFQPNGNITRAEFATIAARFFEATYEGEDLFPDIEGHWARDYINQAAHAGIVNGYPDGTFQPQENITRAEAMTIVNRTLDRHPDADHFLDDMVTWPDNLESAWYYEQVQEATNSHEYIMKTDADKNPYEIWKEILPVRDWSDLENTWSEAHAG